MFTSASQRNHTRYTRLLISGMDAVVATSRKSASYLRRSARVIAHGIDTGMFHPSPDRRAHRRSLGLSENLTIGCYGRIRRQKGTDVFVDAMLEVLPQHAGVTALVMGRAAHKHGPFLQDLREKVARRGSGTGSCSCRKCRWRKCHAGIRRSTCSWPRNAGRASGLPRSRRWRAVCR